MANPEHHEILGQGVKKWNQWRKDNPDVEPDLREAFFSEAKINWAKINWADLREANLSKEDHLRANLNKANLSGANLIRAHLNKANLSRADLIGADLREANLSGADLRFADLSGANLSWANLSGADLSRANLSGANLNKAILSGANLNGAYLIRADLSWADLSWADLSGADLSGVVIDERTTYRRAKGCIKGVNGFYIENTDSAALMPLIPPGDSMKGANASAVIESLKQARSLYVFSMTLAALVAYIAVLQPKEIKLPLIDEKILTGQFGLFAMAFSIVFITLAASFMSDALKGAMYLHSRDDAMTVGQFPWTLSRFSGKHWANKLLSFLIRFVMAFHPFIYLYFIFGNRWPYPKWVFIAFGVILLFLSGWIFFISQGFQRPILFDRKTEEERRSDLAKLAKSVEVQTEAMTKLIVLFEQKQSPSSGTNDTEMGLKE